jgi:hypothetical protein
MEFGRNDDPIGESELFQHLSRPGPLVRGVADGILDKLSPGVHAPVAVAALTFALAEAVIANTSPPQAWAEVISDRLRELIALPIRR